MTGSGRNKLGLVTDAATSARLARIRQSRTRAEEVLLAVLSGAGLRYRIHNRDLPGSPDAANRRRRWAAFVHGCFWHSHPGCEKATVPKRNRGFWLAKFAANRSRDDRVATELRERGFTVYVTWECEGVRGARRVAKRIAANRQMRSNRPS